MFTAACCCHCCVGEGGQTACFHWQRRANWVFSLAKTNKLRVFTGKGEQTASHECSSTSHAGMESANSVEGQTESSGPSNIHALITYKIT